MRPTVIRLIAGGALGVAFSISLTLPGSVVFPREAPIRQLAAPKAPTRTVVRAARIVQRPAKAPVKPRVVVQRVYVPTPGSVRATTVVRRAPPRSLPGRRAKHAAARVGQPVTPLAARPGPAATNSAEEPQDEQGQDEPRKADRHGKSEKPKNADKPWKAEKPKKATKPKGHGSAKKDKSSRDRNEDRDDQGDDRDGHGKGDHGHGRGGHGDHG